MPKDSVKLTTAKKFGKNTRVERPLFDINPRTATELFTRAQAERYSNLVEFRFPDHGITFQNAGEEFTQWQQEAEAAAAPPSPEAPPTSFAEALLRKLNFSEGADSNGIKGTIRWVISHMNADTCSSSVETQTRRPISQPEVSLEVSQNSLSLIRGTH